METLSIGEVSRRSGVAVSAIRYYERFGLLPEPPRSGGRRRYSTDVLSALALIRLGQQVGLTLREMRALRLGTGDGPADPQWAAVLERRVRHTRAEMDRLRKVESLLHAALACGCADLARCAHLGQARARGLIE